MPDIREQSTPLTDWMFRRSSARKIPISGTFELTPTCNFACKMCYVRKSPAEAAASPRGVRTLNDWLTLAEQAASQGMLFVLLTGGEPTIWPDFWTLYEKLCRMGIFVSINTNGSLIDAEAVKRFTENPPKRINITLYGASDETYFSLCGVHGMFERVDRAITLLTEAGIQVKLNCSLTPYNAGDLEEMVRYAKEHQLVLDVNPYMFPPVRRDPGMTGRNDRFTPEESAFYRMKNNRLQMSPEQYRSYLLGLMHGSVPPPGLDEGCVDPVDGRILCRAGSASFWITWDSWLTPCGMMTEPQIDVKDNCFASAWCRLNDASEAIRLSGVCSKCGNSGICHSCAAMAITETGSFSAVPQYLCRTVEELRRLAAEELSHMTDTENK